MAVYTLHHPNKSQSIEYFTVLGKKVAFQLYSHMSQFVFNSIPASIAILLAKQFKNKTTKIV